MQMKKETAKRLINRFEEINKSIFSVLPEFESELSEQEYEFLKREVARMGVMADSKIYPTILKNYPDLDPLKEQK